MTNWKNVTFASELQVGSRIKLHSTEGTVVETPEYHATGRMGAWYAKVRWDDEEEVVNFCLNRIGLQVEVKA